MIYIYGDSHTRFLFSGIEYPHISKSVNSITMYRIGRDNKIVNHNPTDHDSNSSIIVVYGEIDCRCHIHKQISLGREEDDVIQELVHAYFNTLKNNLLVYKRIIVVAIIPPTQQKDYEDMNGPITHEFPFIGTDEDRSRYTRKMNQVIESYCKEYGYIYFDPFESCTRENGCLKYEYSDRTVHLRENDFVLDEIYKLLDVT